MYERIARLNFLSSTNTTCKNSAYSLKIFNIKIFSKIYKLYFKNKEIKRKETF